LDRVEGGHRLVHVLDLELAVGVSTYRLIGQSLKGQ
jgi:hypothetical protein